MTSPGPFAITLADVEAAAVLLDGVALRTPTVRSPALSELTGARVVLKLENLQITGSFKARGALVKLASLGADAARRGVVAASAGNHAQGVAYHARRLGIAATIVVPRNTPFTKIARTEAQGARVILHGESLGEAHVHAVDLARREGREFIHPYDDARIIAGQGTIGLEMLADVPDLDALIVPIGGGGLAAGVAVAAKAVKPAVEILGVQAEAAPSMARALLGEPPGVIGPTVADGIAVAEPGRLTRPIVAALVAAVRLVDEAAIERAVWTMIEAQHLLVEGAGAAPLAALIAERRRFEGRTVGLILSGGNIDGRLTASILMRGLVRAGRLIRLRVEIADAPGALAKVTGLIGEAGGNIVEIYHQRLFHDVPVKLAELDAVIETQDETHARRLVDRLRAAGYRTRLLGSTADPEPD